mgnify:CR=1 FL=1
MKLVLKNKTKLQNANQAASSMWMEVWILILILHRNTYLRGGTLLFAAGLRPFKMAFLAWMMKCLVGDKVETVSTNAPD